MPHFVKYQALGNDYLVVDPQRLDVAICGDNARLLCDRRFGVGADGVLFGPTGPVTPDQPIGLRIFNSDGSECEKSGNGIRIFARYLAEHYPAPLSLTIQTVAGACLVDILDLAAGTVRIGLGGAVIERPGRPLEVNGRQFTGVCVDLGNPHLVVILDEVCPELAQEFGPELADHPRFPHRTNVQFMRVRSRQEVDIEIWERGAGYTLASGSSACAAVSVARRLDLVDGSVTVFMPGGSVTVDVGCDGALSLTGPVLPVASGQLAPDLLHQLVR